MNFNEFIASSACVHIITEHADDISKLLGRNLVILLAMLWKSFCRFMLRKVQRLRHCFSFFRITWRSVILLMWCALRIAVRNSRGKFWRSIWRMTVQIGQSLAASALKRFCGTGCRFVVALSFLSFGLKKSSVNSTLWHTCNCHKRTSILVTIQTPQNHKTKKK